MRRKLENKREYKRLGVLKGAIILSFSTVLMVSGCRGVPEKLTTNINVDTENVNGTITETEIIRDDYFENIRS